MAWPRTAPPSPAVPEPPTTLERPSASLLSRILTVNALVLVAAAVGLALTPATVSTPIALQEVVVLVAGISAMLVVNLFLVRRSFAPLRRLSEMMGQVEPLAPGVRIPVYGEDEEIVRLTAAFNAMLERLERERRHSLRRLLAAQEGERERVARELHDEIGQSLTALLLHLQRILREAPPELREDLDEVREATRATLEEVREVARRLRPEVLDDLGLPEALAALCNRLRDQSGFEIAWRVDQDLPPFSPEVELVVYRVAQEALTNALRHSGGTAVRLELVGGGSRNVLIVRDDGRGLAQGAANGAGLQGIRERAVMIQASCGVRTHPEGGTEVRLTFPSRPEEAR
jgi:two-component system, NarL family, sensor histidine kinase UhpB